MKVTWTREGMIAYARRVLLLDPLRSDCVVEYTDGVDTDAVLEERLRLWYLSLLNNGCRALLCEKELAGSCILLYDTAPSGGSAVRLPEQCVRAFELRMSGWKSPVTVLPASGVRTVARRQGNPFTAATATAPVAVMCADGRTILAYPAGDAVESLKGVTDDGRDMYSFDECALDSIREINLQI